jgi:hypothetical protein
LRASNTSRHCWASWADADVGGCGGRRVKAAATDAERLGTTAVTKAAAAGVTDDAELSSSVTESHLLASSMHRWSACTRAWRAATPPPLAGRADKAAGADEAVERDAKVGAVRDEIEVAAVAAEDAEEKEKEDDMEAEEVVKDPEEEKLAVGKKEIVDDTDATEPEDDEGRRGGTASDGPSQVEGGGEEGEEDVEDDDREDEKDTREDCG